MDGQEWTLAKASLHDGAKSRCKLIKVSVYRLFVHLNTAMIIYSILLWHGLTLLRNSPEFQWKLLNIKDMLKTRKWAMSATHLLGITIAGGSIVAGIDGGKVFNTWPLMNGA